MNLSKEEFSEEDEKVKDRIVEVRYDPGDNNVLLIDIIVFSGMLKACYEAVTRKGKQQQIAKLLASHEWYEHYRDKMSGRKVLSDSKNIEQKHELYTAKAISRVGYDVLFAPKAMFKRNEKMFDVFLIRQHVILKADMKSITSKNPYTIANRIKEGADQASRIIVDICSDIEKKHLVTGLRSGVENNKLIKEIFLFYKNGFYKLPKDLIKSRRIYDIIK